MQSCSATQANKMPLKDREPVGIWPLLLLKAFIAVAFFKAFGAGEGTSVSPSAGFIVLEVRMHSADKIGRHQKQQLYQLHGN